MKLFFKHNETLGHQEVEIYTAPTDSITTKKLKQILEKQQTTLYLIDARNNREVAVVLDDLLLVQSEGRMCHVMLKNGQSYLWNQRLKEVEHTLAESHAFMKINKTSVINIYTVKSFSMTDNFRLEIHLENGHQEVVNRSFTKCFKERLLQR